MLPCLRAVFYCLRCVRLCWLGLCLNTIKSTAPNYIPFMNVPMRCSALVDISDDTDAVLISVLIIDIVLVVCICVRLCLCCVFVCVRVVLCCSRVCLLLLLLWFVFVQTTVVRFYICCDHQLVVDRNN